MAHMFSCVKLEGCLSSFAQAFTGPTLLKLRQRGIVAELWPNGAGFRNHWLNFVIFCLFLSTGFHVPGEEDSGVPVPLCWLAPLAERLMSCASGLVAHEVR